MKSWLHEGARVVCISNELIRGTLHDGGHPLPDIGGVYTVKTVKVVPFGYVGAGDIVADLVECQLPPDEPGRFFGYPAEWLKPVRIADTDATVAALRRCAIDAVKNASGGMGIRKVRA